MTCEQPIHHKFWFWLIIIAIGIIVIVGLFFFLWMMIRNPVSDTRVAQKTVFNFNTNNNFPIITFADLIVPTDTVQPETPPLTYPGITFGLGGTGGSFAVFNNDGIQGPAIINSNGTLTINLSPTVKAVSMKFLELSNIPAVLTVTVLASDNSINMASITVPPDGSAYIAITADPPNIMQINIDRTGSLGDFGITDVQFGSPSETFT